MDLERYTYFTYNDYYDYEFYSEGPKGRIRKVVMFTKIPDIDLTIYNLAFGDQNLCTEKIDDSVISNNQDRNKVLATVANTVVEFCKQHGNHFIYAIGSTNSRTRLYQMGIAGLWNEINRDFEVYGMKNNIWIPFQPNSVIYEAFLLKRK